MNDCKNTLYFKKKKNEKFSIDVMIIAYHSKKKLTLKINI